MINIVNLTPHPITFMLKDKMDITIPPSGTVARLTARTRLIEYIQNIPVTKTEFIDIEGLPEKTKDTIYIVSSLVAQACRDRDDIYIPNESVRNDLGQIIGCRSLGKI